MHPLPARVQGDWEAPAATSGPRAAKVTGGPQPLRQVSFPCLVHAAKPYLGKEGWWVFSRKKLPLPLASCSGGPHPVPFLPLSNSDKVVHEVPTPLRWKLPRQRHCRPTCRPLAGGHPIRLGLWSRGAWAAPSLGGPGGSPETTHGWPLRPHRETRAAHGPPQPRLLCGKALWGSRRSLLPKNPHRFQQPRRNCWRGQRRSSPGSPRRAPPRPGMGSESRALQRCSRPSSPPPGSAPLQRSRPPKGSSRG